LAGTKIKIMWTATTTFDYFPPQANRAKAASIAVKIAKFRTETANPVEFGIRRKITDFTRRIPCDHITANPPEPKMSMPDKKMIRRVETPFDLFLKDMYEDHSQNPSTLPISTDRFNFLRRDDFTDNDDPADWMQRHETELNEEIIFNN
jgi:hypothetical protein